MALATDKQYIKAYGRLPWWRSPAHFQKLLKRSVETSSAIENVSWISLLPSAAPVVSTNREDLGCYASLHWTRDEAVALIHSILSQHPDWNGDQIKREMSRRRGILKSETARRAHPVPGQDNGNIPSQDAATFADTQAQPELNRELTTYEKKVDFVTLDSETKRLASQGTDRVKKLLVESRDKLLALIASRHKAGSLTTKFVLDLELRGLGQLIPTLREVLGSSFRLGQREASKELKKTFAQSMNSGTDAGGVKPAPSLDDPASVVLLVKDLVEKYPDWTRDQIRIEVQRRLKRARGPRIGGFSERALDCEQDSQNKVYQVKLHPEGLPPEKALEFFERKAVLWGADIRQPLLGDIKNILFDGIKQGTSLRDLMTQIGEVYLPWLGDPDQMIDEQMLMPYRLETLVRTNITEALVEGRKAQFQEAADDGFVIGLQYSAVLDTRTCFVPETFVATVDGWRRIDSIKIGDQVWSGSGKIRRVHALKRFNLTESLIRMIFANGQSVQCTDTHPFWTKDGWREAKTLSKGDSCGIRNVFLVSEAIHSMERLSGSNSSQNVSPMPSTVSKQSYSIAACHRPIVSRAMFRQREVAFSTDDRSAENTAHSIDAKGCCGMASGETFLQQDSPIQRAVASRQRNSLFDRSYSPKIWGLKSYSLQLVETLSYSSFGREGILEKASGQASELEDDIAILRTKDVGGSFERRNCRMENSGNNLFCRSGLALKAIGRRVRRAILASWNGGERSKENFRCSSNGMEANSCKGEQIHQEGPCQEQVISGRADCSVIPIPTGWTEVVTIESMPFEGLVCDIEVEEDHSYIVEGGLIVHNTEVCKYLDGKIFPPNSPDTDRLSAPRHWNCRSIWTPITRMEGPVEYITPAQVAKGIELSGKGFSEDCEVVKSLKFDPNHVRDEPEENMTTATRARGNDATV